MCNVLACIDSLETLVKEGFEAGLFMIWSCQMILTGHLQCQKRKNCDTTILMRCDTKGSLSTLRLYMSTCMLSTLSVSFFVLF